MDIEMRLMMGFQEYIYAAVTIFCGPDPAQGRSETT